MDDLIKVPELELKRGLWVITLLARGFLNPHPRSTQKRRWLDPAEVGALVEGVHYVTCPLCDKWFGELSPKHFMAHHGFEKGTSTDDLREAFPDTRFACEVSAGKRVQTEQRKTKQSQTMKSKFEGEEGLLRRERVREQVLSRIQAGGWVKNIAGLRAWSDSPEGKRIQAAARKRVWADPAHRERHRAACGLVRPSRRKQQPKTLTKPHLAVKAALAGGAFPFTSEFRVGPYRIDEAIPGLKLAVEVQGCFWHSCRECGYKGPARTQWVDKAKASYLNNLGWDLFYVWEHQTKSASSLEEALAGIRQRLEEHLG
jgi:G:T-mismatch repair DNA endonuclease (very short patch repair protein)